MGDLYCIFNYIEVAAKNLFHENVYDERTALKVALKDKNNRKFIKNFTTDETIGTLCVQRNTTIDEEEKEQIIYNISYEVDPISSKLSSIGNKINHANSKVSSVVIMKRGDVIKAGECINSQVRVVYFNVKKSVHADANKMAPSVEITFAELKRNLLDLQQEIPEITLTIHPIVADVIKQCADEGRKPNLEDFGDKLQDSSFLNALHDGVNCWTRAIQEVTKLDKDPSSSTASKEINFWLNLEKSLHHIQEQTKGIEVALTLKILNHGKRLHSKESFYDYNGLQLALAIVKKVINCRNLGYKLPINIIKKVHLLRRTEPCAISLIESVCQYKKLSEKIEARGSIIPLLVRGVWAKVNKLIYKMDLDWDSYKIESYCQKLRNRIVNLQERVEELVIIEDPLKQVDVRSLETRVKIKSYSEILSDTIVNFQRRIEELAIIEKQLKLYVISLETCPYSAKTFSDILAKIQNTIDDLSFKPYSNLDIWVRKLSKDVKEKLATRLQAGIQAWIDALNGVKIEKESIWKPGGDPKIEVERVHKPFSYIINDFDPSLEETRCKMLQHLFAWQAIVTSQKMITITRLGMPPIETYRNVLIRLKAVAVAQESAFSAISQIFKEALEYLKEWVTYILGMTDESDDNKYEYLALGEDIAKWIQFLKEMKKERITLNKRETMKEFGIIIVDFTKVQRKMLSGFDLWYEKILVQFSNLLKNAVTSLDAQLSQLKSDFEMAPKRFENSDFIRWKKEIKIYKKGQKILKKQGFQFQSNWLYVDIVQTKWSELERLSHQYGRRQNYRLHPKNPPLRPGWRPYVTSLQRKKLEDSSNHSLDKAKI